MTFKEPSFCTKIELNFHFAISKKIWWKNYARVTKGKERNTCNKGQKIWPKYFFFLDRVLNGYFMVWIILMLGRSCSYIAPKNNEEFHRLLVC